MEEEKYIRGSSDSGFGKLVERIIEANGNERMGHDSVPPIQKSGIHQDDIDPQNKKLRQLQNELENYKSQYNDLYESAPVAFITLTSKGLISRTNATAKALLSYSGEVTAGKGFSRWIHTKDHRVYFACLRKVIEDGKRHSCEVRLIGKSKNLLYVRIEAATHFDEEKRIVEWVLTLSEIPERNQAESDTQLQEQDLRELLNNIVAITGWMTPQGILIEANRVALQAANLKLEDVQGKPLEECYWYAWSPEVQQRLCEAIELAAAGQSSRYDELIRIKEGEFRAIDFMIAPIFSPDGNVSFLIPSATDITERKRLEEQLRKVKEELETSLLEKRLDHEKQRNLLQKIVDNIPVMIFFYSSEGDFHLNRKALETIGITGCEGRNGDIMQRCDQYPQYQKKLTEFMMAASSEYKDVRLRVKDGKEIETSWFNTHLADGHYVSIVIEDSERKTSERKIRKSLKILERDNKMLGNLSVELALSEQLFRQRLADILNDQSVRFLLLAQKGLEDLSLSPQIETRHKHSIENINENINKTIKALSSLGTEIYPSELKTGRLSTILEWFAWWMRRNYGLTIRIQKDFDLILDRQETTLLLFQSVRELLFNIVKHAKVNTASIKLLRDETNQLLVTVTDEGCGFDPGIIWQKAQAGTGFGLLGIRERMAFLGGGMSFKSLPGQGSSFTLIVPINIAWAKWEKKQDF